MATLKGVVDGEAWLVRKLGGRGVTSESDKHSDNARGVVGSETLFRFPRYDLQRRLIGYTDVTIPTGTDVRIFRPYSTSDGRYVATFFLEDAHINVYGRGVVKRRDLQSKRLETLAYEPVTS